jgi:hypothetical protein
MIRRCGLIIKWKDANFIHGVVYILFSTLLLTWEGKSVSVSHLPSYLGMYVITTQAKGQKLLGSVTNYAA